MTAHALLEQADRLGIVLEPEGRSLRVRAPAGTLLATSDPEALTSSP